MQRGRNRILTTHTGSLPRPPGLVELYVRKGRGEAVDAALAEAGMRRVAADVVWAKLAALGEGARIASGRLF